MKYIIIPAMFFVLFTSVNAQVVISEVQISPIAERFIELYNMGDSDIDLTGWYIQRKIATGNFGSFVTSPNFENKTIKAKRYFLISRSPIANADIVLDNLTLTESNIIRVRNSKREDIHDIEWENIDAGKSYQRISSGEWIIGSPTPGSSNDEQENQPVQKDLQPQNSESPASSGGGSSFPIEPQIFADAGGDRNVIVGADSLFEGKALGLQKKPLANARYVWNFGNGETKEGQNVLHYYQYPGEYVVILNVSSGEYSASDRIIVNAYPAELVISKVDMEFVEIHNKSNHELNLSWWQLQSLGERFIIPRDTIILSNKKLIFSSDVTGLDTSVKENVSLLYPNGVEAFSFFQIKIPQKVVITKKAVIKPQPVVVEEVPVIEKDIPENITQTASVISSLSNQNEDGGISKWLLAIFAIVLVSAGAVVFMGKRKKAPGDDIEIVE